MRRHFCALLAYAATAVLFSWPLSMHLGDSLLGSPSGDIGVYVWNLWLFRHEIVGHASSPLYTSEILSLTPPAVLTLHNYTAFADLVGFPLLPVLGVVATFNVVSLVALVLNAYAMFAYALVRTRDGVAAWLGGLMFGFSSFMIARQAEHLSLALAAPLPIFGLLMYRMAQSPSRWLAASSGLVVAWAFACDPYYAVYCLLIFGFMVGHSLVSLDFSPAPVRRGWWTSLLDVAICCVAGLITGIALCGGGQFQIWNWHVSLVALYTPVLLLTLLASLRVALMVGPTFRYTPPLAWRTIQFAIGTAVCLVVLAPVLIAMASPAGSPLATAAPVFWRSSAPGLDLAAYVLPSPFHPWAGNVASWFGRPPNGFTENVASWSWVAIAVLVVATVYYRERLHAGWLAFTGVFLAMSLGPFVHIVGINTFVPTPWAILRYVPIIGAARMPTRLAVLAILGMAMLFAMAVQQIRRRSAHPRAMSALITALLIFELLPAPRPLYSASAPDLLTRVLADARDVRVLNLPFGLRDGLSSRGNHSADAQFQQTFHEKPLVGGYLSRLPVGEVGRYEQIPLIGELLDLSEGLTVEPARLENAIVHGKAYRSQLGIGWVLVDRASASPELVSFCRRALELTLVDRDLRWDLYRAELPPAATP